MFQSGIFKSRDSIICRIYFLSFYHVFFIVILKILSVIVELIGMFIYKTYMISRLNHIKYMSPVLILLKKNTGNFFIPKMKKQFGFCCGIIEQIGNSLLTIRLGSNIFVLYEIIKMIFLGKNPDKG